MKCKKHKRPNYGYLKNNGSALTGSCARCDTNIFRLVALDTGFLKKNEVILQQSWQKLPGTPWEKYPGEKHLPGYRYCGHGTRLDIRLDDQNYPRPGYYPINAIDKTCHAHDGAYKSSNLQHRHHADVKLIHALDASIDKSFKETFSSWLVKSAMKGKLMMGAGN